MQTTGIGGIDWRQIAGFLTVLAICGGFFTWVVSHILYRALSERFTTFEDKLGKTYVRQDTIALLEKEAEQTHARFEKTFSDLWEVVRDIQNDTRR